MSCNEVLQSQSKCWQNINNLFRYINNWKNTLDKDKVEYINYSGYLKKKTYLNFHFMLQYCLRPVMVHTVEGNHRTVLSNPKTGIIISECLNAQETSLKTSLFRPPTQIGKLNEAEKQI